MQAPACGDQQGVENERGTSSAGVMAAPFIAVDNDSLTPPIELVAIPASGLTL